MANVQITEQQANALRALKAIKKSDRDGYKAARKSVFDNIRAQYGIPADVRMSIQCDAALEGYRVVKVRPPGAKSVAYVPIEAGPDGRYVLVDAGQGTAAAEPAYGVLPLDKLAALLRSEGDQIEGFSRTVRLPEDAIDIGDNDQGDELHVDDNNIYFAL